MVQTPGSLLCIWGRSEIQLAQVLTPLILHQVSPTWGCAGSHCPSQLTLLVADVPVCHSRGSALRGLFPAASPCEHRLLHVHTEHAAQWQSQHVCWQHHSQPAGAAPFILTWQGNDSSSFHSWNGCAVAQSRMGPALLCINLSLPGNTNRWLPAVWTPAAGWNTVLPTPAHGPRCAKTTFCQCTYYWVLFFWITPVTPDTKGIDGFF